MFSSSKGSYFVAIYFDSIVQFDIETPQNKFNKKENVKKYLFLVINKMISSCLYLPQPNPLATPKSLNQK